MWMRRVIYLLAGCCMFSLLRKTMAARSGRATGIDTDRLPETVGPCSWKVVVNLSEITIGNLNISSGQMTMPACNTFDRIGLVLFHSGFSGVKEYYKEYADTLASWGWAVLQYDLDCFHVPFGGPCPQLQDIMDEVHALPAVLTWAHDATAAVAPHSAARIDWSNVVVGGHSRGAEVSARTATRFPAHGTAAPLPKEFLDTARAEDVPGADTACAGTRGCTGSAIAKQPRVQAILLVDPVAKRPTTTPLIGLAQPFFAIVGMGSRWCAPKSLGADNFIPRADPPLTQAVHIPQAGHAQFWQAPRHWQATYDFLCSTGTESDATIRAWTARLLVDWLQQNLPPLLEEDMAAHVAEDNERWFKDRVKAGDFEPWHRS